MVPITTKSSSKLSTLQASPTLISRMRNFKISLMTLLIRIIKMWKRSWKHLVFVIRSSLTLSRLRKDRTTLSIMLRRPMSSPLSTVPDILDLHLTIAMMMETWSAKRGTENASLSFLMLSNLTRHANACQLSLKIMRTIRSWSSVKAPIQSLRNASNRARILLRPRKISWMTLLRLACVHFWSPARKLLKNTIIDGQWTTSKPPHLTIRRGRWIGCQTSWSKILIYSGQLR